MDKSFSSPISVKSPFSPRSRQNISSKRILPASFRKSSRLSLSAKSTQSVQVVLKSTNNYAERFGQSLPVLITEALTFADRNTIVSARISECGYAWVVCGRRLLIWQYRQSLSAPGTPQRKLGSLNQCFELQLPQSDLAHRAELVSVFINVGSNIPSCIAVSPEGVLRYWPAIAHEGITVEQTVDLQGQECDSLTNVEGLCCILATTTCTVVLIHPEIISGRHVLNCKPLKAPSGWLGGISKRMSSLIFGPISSEQSNETRLVRVLSVPNKDSTWTIYVLAGHSLQKWILSNQDNEQLVFMSDLNRAVREKFQTTLREKIRETPWDQSDMDSWLMNSQNMDTWLLDIQADKDNIIILAAAVNTQISPRVHYALISFSTGDSHPEIRDFVLLMISGLYRDDNPSESLSYRFLICGTSAYLYNDKTITVIRPQEEPDVFEFTSSQDVLLGGSICINTPVFFSRINGLIAVCSNDQISDFINQSMTSNTPVETSFNETAVNNLSVYVIDPQEIHSAYKDTMSQMKAAFIFHIRNQQSAYQEILNELFPVDSYTLPSINSTLDKLVIQMSKDLLDDIPAGDPRWTKDAPPGIGSSYSMQVLHQLEDKQKAMSLYFKFLKDSELWNKLSGCIVRNTTMATVHILGECLEKISAAIICKSLPNNILLENAIEKAIINFESEPGNGLTNQDIFYREVSKVHTVIQELSNCCEDSAHSDLSPIEIAQNVHDTNEIILTVINEVIQFRNQSSNNFIPSESTKSLDIEYLPWTAANGDEGLTDTLMQQHILTYSYGLKLVSQGPLRNSLLDHFVGITDLLLDGKKSHLESVHNANREKNLYRQYCTDRHKLIKPLLNEKEYEKAILLAEKYLDFETLVTICDATDNQERLDEYMDRFSNNGFSEYVYNWFLKENKQGKLLDKYRKTGKTKNLQKLSTFLSDHPSLSWMQQIFDKKFPMAANTLYTLATNEKDSLTRQKTMLSLCKLSKLAGPMTGDLEAYIENINNRLGLINCQEELPDYVLQQFGYDTLKPCVISPKELINLYTCKEYVDASELEFKKALDILNFIQDEELIDELHLSIWRRAILRDSWNFKNLDCPMEVLSTTLFYKIVDLLLDLGVNPQTLLPPINMLLDSPELGQLKENPNFEFLIKTAYEYINRTQIME
ncbi:nuclear pore complex protein Nup133 [Diorhabda carinulata]|uniref:nuclear pore complex protein Nup133 n=1 Tax=Diorhabda carinulata TaxID=1163345 RepID=UPI0025A26150|nr:nuclear pore complex protein Nup133 [Diorhabda carinulata]